MRLPKGTLYRTIEIREPIWGSRSVGIASHKIGDHNVVKITKTDVSGDLVYGHNYYVSGDKLRSYPTEPARGNKNVILHVIPIDDMEVIENQV
jgi:hypothetical protein